MPEISVITDYINQQNEKRKLWEDNDDPEQLAGMLIEEAQELQEAIQEALVTGDVFSVASEIGDLQYLIIKLCSMIGIDPMQATEMKIFRNERKYGDHTMSNGRDFQTASEVSKQAWNALGGDYAFSRAYLDYLAHD